MLLSALGFQPAFADACKQTPGLLGILLLNPGPLLLPSPPLPPPLVRERWALLGKPTSQSGGLRKRPAPGRNRQPLPAGKRPALSKYPANPALRPGACQPKAWPGGAYAGLLVRRRGIPRRRRDREPRVRCPSGVEAGRGPPQPCRSACPVSRRRARPKPPPRARLRAAGPSLHLDERRDCPPSRRLGGRLLPRAAASCWEEARSPEGRRRPPRFPCRYAPSYPRVPHGWGRRRRLGSRFPEDRLGGRGPSSRWLRPWTATSGAGTRGPRRPAVCSRRPIPSFHVVARARKLSRARRRWVGGGCLSLCVQKRRLEVSHLVGESSNGMALSHLGKMSASSRSPRGTRACTHTPLTGFCHSDFLP